MFKTRLPTTLVIISLLQFVPVLIVPPETLKGFNVAAGVAVVIVFGLLGANLLRCRSWARVATVFVQGVNIIVRLLVLVGHSVVPGETGNVLDVAMVVSMVLSMLISAVVLYYVDMPDIQAIMQ